MTRIRGVRCPDRAHAKAIAYQQQQWQARNQGDTMAFMGPYIAGQHTTEQYRQFYTDPASGNVWDGSRWLYWDGANWQPLNPTVSGPWATAAPQPHQYVSKTRRNTSHGFHLVMTFLTGGLWGLFVWAPMVAWHKFGPRQRTITRAQ